MNKVSIIAHQKYVEDIVYRLHEIGLMEIKIISEIEELEKTNEHPDTQICIDYETRLTRIIDILRNISLKPMGLKSILNPSIPEVQLIEEINPEELYSKIEGILSSIEQDILSKYNQLQKLDEELSSLRDIQEKVKLLTGFDILLSDQGESPYLVLKIGETSELESLKEEVDKLEYTTLFSKQISHGRKKRWVVVLVAHISEKREIENLCRMFLTLFDIPSIRNTPKEFLMKTEKDIRDKDKKKNEIIKQLRRLAGDHLQVLLALREEIQLEKERKEIYKNFMKTDNTMLIQGWIPERDIDTLKIELYKAAEDHTVVIIENPSGNPDEPPTLLDIPPWASSFKTLLQLFATPRYNEINPTVIMGIFFVLFFGFMLGDAGYGLIILLLSFFGYIKLKASPLIKTWSFLGIWLGLSAIIVGILTNSFFGDFIPRFIYGNPDKPLYTINIAGLNLPVDSLRDPLTILIISLILGLIHLNIGIILGIYQTWKRGEYRKMLMEHISWIPLQIGGAILIGVSILDWDISFPILLLATVLVIIGILQLLIKSGPMGFFDITGYVGDWLSYARLLALGLATAGMALAFNIIAVLIPSLLPIPYIGVILLPIILIITHFANLLIQSLGAAVHSLRLQYVEFFNRFYEGGGYEFTPFKIKRRYTKLKTEGEIR